MGVANVCLCFVILKMDAISLRRQKILLCLFRYKLACKRNSRIAKSAWVREILIRKEMGEFHSLIQEMRLVYHASFHMMHQQFQCLLSTVGPLITHQTTTMRSPVSPGERLAVSLRYLVTCDSMLSIVLLAICDADYCFTFLNIGNYGRHSDRGIFSNSLFGQALEDHTLQIPDPDVINNRQTIEKTSYFPVGDTAFPLTYLFKTISWKISTL